MTLLADEDVKLLLHAIERDYPNMSEQHRHALVRHVREHGLRGDFPLTPFLWVSLDSLAREDAENLIATVQLDNPRR